MNRYFNKYIIFFIFIINFSTFSNSNENKIPNEYITDNPKKEVTTIETIKNRNHAQMKFTVKKINPIEINGKEIDDKLEFEILDEINKDYKILLTSSLPKVMKNNLSEDRILDKALSIPFELKESNNKVKLIIDKFDYKKNLYIIIHNNIKIIKVYRTKNLDKSFSIKEENILDFENMTYSSEKSTYTAKKLFTVSNSKNIDFKIETKNVRMVNSNNDYINIDNILLKKLETLNNKTFFMLEASVNIDKNTASGFYKGEIPIIITIDSTSNKM